MSSMTSADPHQPKLKDLVAVVDLQSRLIMPGRTKPITRANVHKLINKVDSKRYMLASGQGAKAYISKAVADEVETYFRRLHSIKG